MSASLVGSEMCIRDRSSPGRPQNPPDPSPLRPLKRLKRAPEALFGGGPGGRAASLPPERTSTKLGGNARKCSKVLQTACSA
eukprot:3969659-Alexandrium_andersonii.AAC.1